MNSYLTSHEPEHILLTGATGFIGSHVNELLDYRCTVAVRKPVIESKNSKTIILSKILDTDSTVNYFKDINAIIHLASIAHKKHIDFEELQSVNVENTLKLARNALKHNVKRFVFVSSIGVNGLSTLDKPFSNLSLPEPHNPYAKSKLDAELALKELARETALELVIVRPTLVYGAQAPGSFGSLTKLVHLLPFLPFGLASNKRDFIYVQNLASLLITCAKHPNAAGHTFLASDGETVSIKEFTNEIAGGLNKNLIQLPFPVSLMRLSARLMGKSAMVEQLLGNLQVDSSNAQEVLGWTPPYTMKQAMASLSEKTK
ncbi:NAD-dependent epimerase/dehydratase family protein [Shewanella psychromarinicola]|uniref:NAD-dependent epimerase/dehydratase family protein n=1 Tax=Shewanella psychromarinicola TaxID=2487742 RepID=A0A3N4E7U5_9GAMM|nr:NAD-dependent epimerase/dehydratase family protein [Shewanella psychromarinicola]AZG35363.1 NAD-dependent epimerase/dehydratase family protein [Shewanella psychromarinicola]MCL1083604.1 NAD-dependent epimerase/dehydratase family protein [Shewanella psychromarinicola]RPA32832.1 NAD-dependent epimerase/dehydratase family protein [Shewanella psychromarinicola]